MKLPEMAVIEQLRAAPAIRDVRGATLTALDRHGGAIARGASVAITAGSRKMAYGVELLAAVAEFVKAHSACPFIVPAMGSHGGATAQGQADLLAAYGITEETVGAPVRSSMDVIELGATGDGVRVYMDALALSADAIVVVNRVKAHTKFFGAIQSGLTKMTLVGLGKHEGAVECHRAAETLGFDRVAETAAPLALKRAPIAFGLALVENGDGGLAHIEAVEPDGFLAADQRLLKRAEELTLRLPFNDLDLLIVDRMGKDISGTGMDVNVVGAREGSGVRIGRILVRDLTDASEGNAHGIGLAHVTTDRLARKVDMEATLANARAARREEAARIPAHFETDRECLEHALAALNGKPARIVQISDTLHLRRLRISRPLLEEALSRADLRLVSPPAPPRFDLAGNLLPWQ